MVDAEIIIELITENGCLQSIRNIILLHILEIVRFIHVTAQIRTGPGWDRSFQSLSEHEFLSMFCMWCVVTNNLQWAAFVMLELLSCKKNVNCFG
jgi:hypothetical protein